MTINRPTPTTLRHQHFPHIRSWCSASHQSTECTLSLKSHTLRYWRDDSLGYVIGRALADLRVIVKMGDATQLCCRMDEPSEMNANLRIWTLRGFVWRSLETTTLYQCRFAVAADNKASNIHQIQGDRLGELDLIAVNPPRYI